MKSKVITRFPPSPTGYMHIGRARTALFNYIYSRQHEGEMIFRLEDTDSERSKPEYEQDIIDGLKWLGIGWDNTDLIRQSERTQIYQRYLKQLVEAGKAYVSAETNEETGKTNEVVRFKNPNSVIKFTDLIRGEIEFDTTELGDFIIARNIEEPLYHLTVVVDDHEMGITHVIRGEDGISNTPRQILIQEAIGAARPIYAHLPLILAADRSKLSGRHGAVSVREFQQQGYLPEAIINYLALLGWNPGTEQEIFTLSNLIEQFSLEKVQKSGAIFDLEKLKWINREHLGRKTYPELKAIITSFIPEDIKSLPQYTEARLEKAWPILMERLSALHELTELANTGQLQYYFDQPKYDSSLLKTTEHLPEVINLIEQLDDNDFNAENVKNAIWNFATEKGRGEVLWPMRVALSGQEKSPDPFTLAALFGKAETLARLKQAVS
jgi:glutamyl-tRNA synthetase